ncbi:hypothetical protein [Nocardia sp. NPDC051832]|uniref:hypothetical protein n=1 Tax=Nocardia sp. NPDC051832 TaxID=3155673 RepID=UPI00341CBDC5
MRLEGQRWRTLINTVRLGREAYRVVRPARPIEHAPLHEGCHGVQITVDKTAARTLAMAWALAARSPRTLVYLPLRHNGIGCNEYGHGTEPALDLVLLHHSLGFPAARWKDVRAKLTGGRPHTVVCRGLPAVPDASAATRHHRGFKDILRQTIAADTLFLTGSRTAFALEGDRLRALIEECPRHMHEQPDTHCCAEITVDGHWQWLHVEYCRVHRVTGPS